MQKQQCAIPFSSTDNLSREVKELRIFFTVRITAIIFVVCSCSNIQSSRAEMMVLDKQIPTVLWFSCQVSLPITLSETGI